MQKRVSCAEAVRGKGPGHIAVSQSTQGWDKTKSKGIFGSATWAGGRAGHPGASEPTPTHRAEAWVSLDLLQHWPIFQPPSP